MFCLEGYDEDLESWLSWEYQIVRVIVLSVSGSVALTQPEYSAEGPWSNHGN